MCDLCGSPQAPNNLVAMLSMEGELRRGVNYQLCQPCYARIARELPALLQRVATAPRPVTTGARASRPGSCTTEGGVGA
jgi:hypothetical protein